MLLTLDIAGWSALLEEKMYDRGVPPIITQSSSRILMIHRIPVEVHRKISYRIRDKQP
ncbi:MAG: hypothetical protein K8R21_10690 [Leptospira sp.]|nr:hypothetical protein [Leptospira sp.]